MNTSPLEFTASPKIARPRGYIVGYNPQFAPRSVDELLFHWSTVCRVAKDEWARGFALSIAKARKRPRWEPSAKQVKIMRQMVGELFSARDDDFNLIEREG